MTIYLKLTGVERSDAICIPMLLLPCKYLRHSFVYLTQFLNSVRCLYEQTERFVVEKKYLE